MVKIFVPNISNTSIGGGFTFKTNFVKALNGKVQFVDRWQDCDVVFVFSITTIDKGELHEAIRAGKKLVLRVDNIPRKSRNKRQSPAERLAEFGKLGMVIYQSEWAKEYAGYFAGDGVVIYNGVDTDIFNEKNRNSDGKTFLYADYNPNPNKRFDEALYWFDMSWREDNSVHLIIAGNVPRIYLENPEFNWDVPTNGKIEYVGIKQTLEEMAELYKKCDYLLYPSFAEACPNVISEAMACGLEVVGTSLIGGTVEVMEKHKDKPYTIQEMGEEYLRVFEEVCEE